MKNALKYFKFILHNQHVFGSKFALKNQVVFKTNYRKNSFGLKFVNLIIILNINLFLIIVQIHTNLL